MGLLENFWVHNKTLEWRENMPMIGSVWWERESAGIPERPPPEKVMYKNKNKKCGQLLYYESLTIW